MKTISRFIYFLLFITTSLFISSCSLNDDDTNQNQLPDSLADLLAKDTNLSSLVAALEAADNSLITTLDNAGSYTILAPTNAAFETFLDGRQLSDIPKETLKKILLYHIIPGAIKSTDFTNAIDKDVHYTITFSDGPETSDISKLNIFFNTNNGLTFNDVAKKTGTELEANNGILHTVDAVITLPTIMTFISADANFSSFKTSLNNSNNGDLSTLLAMDGETDIFTVFAPINDAFTELPNNTTEEELEAILKHHIIDNNNIRGEEISDKVNSPATLEGDKLNFTIENPNIFVQDGTNSLKARIIYLNIQANNGVIHGINRVLLPDTTN